MCVCIYNIILSVQAALFFRWGFLWLMRALLTQTCPFFTQAFFFCCCSYSLLVCVVLDASHYIDVVALSSFFSQFTFSCSFPVAPSSGRPRSTPPPGSYSLYSSALSVALVLFPHYSVSLTPLFVCVLCGCALMGGSFSACFRLAGKDL